MAIGFTCSSKLLALLETSLPLSSSRGETERSEREERLKTVGGRADGGAERRGRDSAAQYPAALSGFLVFSRGRGRVGGGVIHV
ncbi:uncharacterized [Tachysurus ichikawai]